MSEHKKELSQPLAILGAGLIVGAAIIFTHFYPSATAAQPAAAGNNALPANVSVKAPSADDHIIGSLSAPIVLIEYSDFQCPYCSMIYPTLKRIVSESNGQIAWIMREYPLFQIHPNAEPAANAAECIAEQKGSAGYWKFVDTVFGDQANIGEAMYQQVATTVGVDMTKYKACVAAKTYQKRIDAETQDAQDSGGNGTPFTVVYGNGKQVPISGALPYAQIMSIIKSVQGK